MGRADDEGRDERGGGSQVVFALRSMLDAAVADQRLAVNPAANIPLPVERAAEQRYLDREQVLTLADLIAPRYRALVLLGAFGGLRWGEMAGLRRSRVDVLRSRVTVCETATDSGGKITFGLPKTKTSKRTVPLARSIMAEIELHLGEYVQPGGEALVFTSTSGGPLYRGTFWPSVWRPGVKMAGLDGLRVHDLRHTYVSLMVAAGGESEGGVHLGGALVGQLHSGPLRAPLRRAYRRRCRPARHDAVAGTAIRRCAGPQAPDLTLLRTGCGAASF